MSFLKNWGLGGKTALQSQRIAALSRGGGRAKPGPRGQEPARGSLLLAEPAREDVTASAQMTAAAQHTAPPASATTSIPRRSAMYPVARVPERKPALQDRCVTPSSRASRSCGTSARTSEVMLTESDQAAP